MNGVREEVYVFDYDGDGKLLSQVPKSVTTNDTRIFSDEQAKLLDEVRFARRRVLSFTDEEAADDIEQVKNDPVLKAHRKEVRRVCNTQIAALQAAMTLAELDAIPWATEIDAMVLIELPNTLGHKDPTTERKRVETKSSKVDDIPSGNGP